MFLENFRIAEEKAKNFEIDFSTRLQEKESEINKYKNNLNDLKGDLFASQTEIQRYVRTNSCTYFIVKLFLFIISINVFIFLSNFFDVGSSQRFLLFLPVVLRILLRVK